MSAKIINLNKARKAKARAGKEKQAAENRVLFGRSKAERENAHTTAEIERLKLDGLKRGEAAPSDDDGLGPGNVS